MLIFFHVDPDLGYWYIVWKDKQEIGGSIWKTPFAYYASQAGDFMHSLSFFSGDLHFDTLIIGLS